MYYLLTQDLLQLLILSDMSSEVTFSQTPSILHQCGPHIDCLHIYFNLTADNVIIIIIINGEIIVAFSPKTTRTCYKVRKTAKCVLQMLVWLLTSLYVTNYYE